MKKIILGFSFAVVCFNTAFSQKIAADNIPAVVSQAFKARFSIAEKAQWEMDYDNYQSDFTVGNADFSATFDKDGKWLKTESFIKPSSLPKNIKNFVTKNFPGYKIDDETEKLETPEKGTTYEFQISKDELTYAVSMSEAGEMLKHEAVGSTK
jgi:hypothetical protein